MAVRGVVVALLCSAALAGAAAAAPASCGVGGECSPGGGGGLYGLGARLAGPGGAELALSALRGRVALVVNTASLCGYTEEGYEAMARLARRYRDLGLAVVAAPSDEFGGQEPDDGAAVLRRVRSRWDPDGLITVLDKLAVNGDAAHPLFVFLRGGSGDVAWNFAKFVVGRDGSVVARLAPDAPWADVERAVRGALVQYS